jgi:hypothetical protein
MLSAAGLRGAVLFTAVLFAAGTAEAVPYADPEGLPVETASRVFRAAGDAETGMAAGALG